jgi:hypothetical protein
MIDLRNIYENNDKIARIFSEVKNNLGDFDLIITNMRMYNIIEDSSSFHLSQSHDYITKNINISRYYDVGYLFGVKVTVDLELTRTDIVLTYSIEKKRELILNSLLNDSKINNNIELEFIF